MSTVGKIQSFLSTVGKIIFLFYGLIYGLLDLNDYVFIVFILVWSDASSFYGLIKGFLDKNGYVFVLIWSTASSYYYGLIKGFLEINGYVFILVSSSYY